MLLEDALNTVVHPALQFVHDLMHCLLVHGVFNIVVQLLLTRCKEVGSNIGSILDEYMQLWTWPAKFDSASIGKTFSPKNLDASAAPGFLKCQASDSLSMTQSLRFLYLRFWCLRGNAELNAKRFWPSATL